MVSDVNEGPVLELAEEITRQGGEAAFVTGDVSNSRQAEQMVRKTVDEYGRLDIVVTSSLARR